MTENDINKKMAAGFYRDVDLQNHNRKMKFKMQLIS